MTSSLDHVSPSTTEIVNGEHLGFKFVARYNDEAHAGHVSSYPIENELRAKRETAVPLHRARVVWKVAVQGRGPMAFEAGLSSVRRLEFKEHTGSATLHPQSGSSFP